MDRTAIVLLFLGSLALVFLAAWGHARLAGPTGKPGAASMMAFVLAWLGVITAVLTGAFLALTLLG